MVTRLHWDESFIQPFQGKSIEDDQVPRVLPWAELFNAFGVAGRYSVSPRSLSEHVAAQEILPHIGNRIVQRVRRIAGAEG